MIPLQFLDQVQHVSQPVADEFESMASALKGYLLVEHKEDGTHGDITADSITADEATLGSATVEEITVASGTMAGTFTGDVVANVLKLNPHDTWDVASGETDLLNSTAAGAAPTSSLWYLTRSGASTTINGIAANLVTGNPGQVIVLINDSAFFLSFESAVVTSAKRIYGCSPAVKIGPGGMIAFVYDETHLGWRFLCSTRDYNADRCGRIELQASATIAPGWLELGQDVSRTTYAALFAEIGTTWGMGDGSTTFGLPPKGIFPILAGGTPALAVGAQGGNWNHTHPLPDHTHAKGTLAVDSGGNHAHGVEGDTGPGSPHAHGIPFTTLEVQAGSGATVVDSVGGFDESTDLEDEHVHDAGTLSATNGGAHDHTISGDTAAAGASAGPTGAANPPYAAFVGVIRT